MHLAFLPSILPIPNLRNRAAEMFLQVIDLEDADYLNYSTIPGPGYSGDPYACHDHDWIMDQPSTPDQPAKLIDKSCNFPGLPLFFLLDTNKVALPLPYNYCRGRQKCCGDAKRLRIKLYQSTRFDICDLARKRPLGGWAMVMVASRNAQNLIAAQRVSLNYWPLKIGTHHSAAACLTKTLRVPHYEISNRVGITLRSFLKYS